MRWVTGDELMSLHGLRPFDLATLRENGLLAHDPDTGYLYIDPSDCPKYKDSLTEEELKSRFDTISQPILSAACEGAGVDPSEVAPLSESFLAEEFRKFKEKPAAPAGHKILPCRADPTDTGYARWLQSMKDAVFLNEDVEDALARLNGNRLPSERIADLERQLAEARQENEALTNEVERLRAEARTPEPRRRGTYLAVIAALACPDGQWAKLQERGLAARIVKILDLCGIKKSESPVKNVLMEAFEFMEEKT